MKSLAIIITHPIQYYVPVFRLLSKSCKLKVYYTWGIDGYKDKYDPDFKQTINWDLPLLDGYEYEFLENTSKNPGSHHAKGIINPNIIENINLFNPDAIVVYGYIYNSHFQVMRYFKGKKPIWFRGDSTLLDNLPSWKKLLKFIYLKWVYNYIDKAFYVGSNNKKYFKQFGLKDSQLVFSPHAVDNQRFEEDRKLEALKLRNSLNIASDDMLILFAGKLEPKKKPDLLLDVFLQIVEEKRHPTKTSDINKTHLLFVGNGALENSLKARSLKKQTQIHFLDFQNQMQMPIVYQACDIFCLPSKGPGETWGLAVNEAMACGKAIVVSDKVGCAVDLIQNGVNGYIFKSEDISDLKEKLSISKKQAEKMGQASKKIIQNWSFDLQTEVLINSLNQLC